MAGFGSAILSLLGQTDPRKALLAATLGAQGGQPAGAPGSTAAGAAGAPGASTPAGPPQPAAYSSPPQLLELYDTLLSRSSREKRVDQGIGLIASSFARPENRAAILSATQGEYESPSDVFGMVTGIQELQTQAAAKEAEERRKAAQLADLPALAEQYGFTPEAGRLMFDNEQLDDYIMQADKAKLDAAAKDPNNEIKELQDGTTVVINRNTGSIVAQVGPSGTGATTGQQDYTAYVKQETEAGREPLSFNNWDLQGKKASATNVNNNLGGTPDNALIAGLDKTTLDEFTTAGTSTAGAMQTIQSARGILNDPAGTYNGRLTSQAELEIGKFLVSSFGGDPSKITNTESYQSLMQSLVLPQVKQLGTGNSISNADREFIAKMTAADITVNPDSARRILSILEKANKRKLDDVNKKMKNRIEASPADSGIKSYPMEYKSVPLSREYVEETTASLDEGDKALLIQNISNPEARKEFDAKYGDEASRDMFEALTGTDPGPLSYYE